MNILLFIVMGGSHPCHCFSVHAWKNAGTCTLKLHLSSAEAVSVAKKASGWLNTVKADVQKNWSTCVPNSDELSQVPGSRKDA